MWCGIVSNSNKCSHAINLPITNLVSHWLNSY